MKKTFDGILLCESDRKTHQHKRVKINVFQSKMEQKYHDTVNI